MLGVIANPAEECFVREFFELFKTPWEFYRADCRYDVVLCAGDADLDQVSAKLLVVYSNEKTGFDAKRKVQIQSKRECTEVSFAGTTFPIYGDTLTFRDQGTVVIRHQQSRESVAYVDQFGEGLYARVGYDLFHEVRVLLVTGQPFAMAATPTLDLHIAFLRCLITGSGIPLVEIPPVPDGYPFIACLTHDLDHASIRRHKFDATIFGFLYRATLGSVMNWFRGRLSLTNLFTNWSAAVKLPLVYAGLARDFWSEFDRYLDIEKGRPSTFFVIPFANHPGRSPGGLAPQKRACRYDVTHITGQILRLKASGCEIGLHGIDAWVESTKGREEARRISEITATAELGVRMHWLYSDDNSPVVLEEAGFSYDSTVGYNDTVGYRAGTGQVFKPAYATRLLELPMHVMDTALFYPDYLNFSEKEAWDWLVPFFNNAIREGGVLTFNWHDRSIAPERLWGNFYVRVLDELTARGAWFCTAAQAVSWFRQRRSAVFERAGDDSDGVRIHVLAEHEDNLLPGLRLRLHRPQMPAGRAVFEAESPEPYHEISFKGSVDAHVLESQIQKS